MGTATGVSTVPARCPKYLKLAQEFERQLRAGVLRIGDRLPSVRQLRDTHRVSVATAVGCYAWLERQGYIRARPKSGFYVSRAPQLGSPTEAPAPTTRDPIPVRVGAFGSLTTLPAGRRSVIDLGPAVVGPDLLPRNRLNQSLRMALSAFTDNAVRYEDSRGSLRLRRQIARLVFRQGATCSPDDIVVTSGVTEAFNLSIRAVARAGNVVAVESPGCFEILRALEALQLNAIEIPHVPKLGVNIDLLETTTARHPIKAILMTATCHNPVGDCVDDERKALIVRFAAERRIPIIEGDAFGDLVFSGERPRPLKAFDTTGIVLQCASLAHYVAPGFNLGWVNAGRWQPEVERLKSFTNVANARLPQLAMAEFLESGAFDKHLKHLRPALRQSVDAAREDVLRTFPEGTRVDAPEGGFVLWIQLPNGFDGRTVQREAAAEGIHLLPGPVFSPSGDYANFIRIACAQPIDTLRSAIRAIAGRLADLRLSARLAGAGGPARSSM
jgi:DNA-binding transcriptional MocR family regulator